MPVFSVSSSDQLTKVLANAKSGDTIALASGTYAPIIIRGVNAGGITITSADPSHQAVLTGLTVRDSSGITVSHVEMSSTKTSGAGAFMTYGSRDIHFDSVDVHGPAGLGSTTTVEGLGIRESLNVSVTNSSFHDVFHGLTLGNNIGATVTGNSFHDIRTDGVRGGGNSEMLVANNLFTNFTPADGDHADAIQLWTTNTTTAAYDITIADNLVVRGAGAAIQGVFIRDETDKLPYVNVNVTGNMVLGGNANGIALNGVASGTIIGNSVIGADDQRSWIRVDESGTVNVKDNLSTYYMVDGASRDGVLAGNAMALDFTGSGALQVGNWLAQHTDLSSKWGMSASVMAQLGLSVAEALPARAVAPTFVTVDGTAGDDKLKVKAGFDSHLYGGAGDDSLTGADTGHNQLYGGAGDDNYIIKGIGDSVIEYANGGYDTVSTSIDYTLTDNVEVLRLAVAGLTGTGNDLDNRIIGTSGIDHIYGMAGDDVIQGLDGNDFIFGGLGDDDLRADAGNDTVYGGAGNDTILGGVGDDLLFGDNGNDIIEGGAGKDIMTGGAGADVFRFRAGDISGDVITDFTHNQDYIDLRSIDAKIGTAKDDAFTWIQQSAFHHIAGELRYQVVDGNAIVSGDVNGDGKADFSFTLLHVTQLAATDFLL